MTLARTQVGAWARFATLLALGATTLAMAGEQKPASQPAPYNERDRPLEITRSGSRASERGPADNFTGSVQIDSRFQRSDPARVGGAIVTFEPGARTAWHTHPLGQTLIVTSGSGWVQREGGPKEDIRPGDIVWIPPGVKHWHGATPNIKMTHIAITEALDGNLVKWMEHVSAEQCGGGSRMQGRAEQ